MARAPLRGLCGLRCTGAFAGVVVAAAVFGVAVAWASCGVAGVAGGVAAVAHVDPSFWPIAIDAAARFLRVMIPFAVLVILAFGVRLVPSIDWKCISSVVVFGPCVLVRPALMVAATAYAVVDAPHSVVLYVLAALALTAMLTAEAILRKLIPIPSTPSR